MTGCALSGRRVVIAEDDPNGHRLVYARHLVEFAADAGADVTMVVSPRVLASEQWRLNLQPLQERMRVHEVEAVELGPLAEATRALRAEHTVVPDGDYLAMRVGALRRWKGAGTLSVLLIRDPADESPTTWKRRLELGCKSALFWQARRRAGVHIVGLRSALAEPAPGEVVALEPLEAFADDGDVKRLRDDWELADERYWFGVVGAVTSRKNLPMIAEALTLAASAHGGSALGLVVAGPCHADVLVDAAPHLERLRALDVAVVLVDRVLGPVEFDAAVRAVDCLVIAHSNEGPSAVIARAGMHAIPVVAAGARSLARDVTRLPAAVWTELDASQMSAAMYDMRAKDEPVERLDLGTEQFCRALLGPLLQAATGTDVS